MGQSALPRWGYSFAAREGDFVNAIIRKPTAAATSIILIVRWIGELANAPAIEAPTALPRNCVEL